MSFRRSSRVAPSNDLNLDFLEGLDLNPSTPSTTTNFESSPPQLLFSSTAPAPLNSSSLKQRSAEDIYNDILGVEAVYSSSDSCPVNIVPSENNSSLQPKNQTISFHDSLQNDPKFEASKILEEREHASVMDNNSLFEKGSIPSVEISETEKPTEKVKGVSTGVMHVPGLMDSINKNNLISIKFPCSPLARICDIERLASELSYGIYVSRALPWVSIESTHHRGAARLVALHPTYRNTLTGLIFTEIDTALKAVGGTARGGLFLSTTERNSFLMKECLGRNWGPNGQKRPPEHLINSHNIKKNYPSFTFSDEIFNSNEVSFWRQEWEAVWSGDTGMDIQGQLKKLELITGNSRQHASSGRSDEGAEILVYSDWGVAIHDDGAGERVSEVRQKGEALCRRLLPTVPIPSATTLTSASDVASKSTTDTPTGDVWLPPSETKEGQTLTYLFELLKVITGLASIFESARIDHPTLMPSSLSAEVVDYLTQQSHKGTPLSFSPKSSVEWLKCSTPMHIPFEPSIDRETNAVFLGGGVGIRAAPCDVLKRKRRLSTTNTVSFLSLNLSWTTPSPTLAKAIQYANALGQTSNNIFYHQVVAFGLWNNYSSSHNWLSHPQNKQPHSESPTLDAKELAHYIHTILPDGYCRRLKKSCFDILVSDLLRQDAAEAYMDLLSGIYVCVC